MRAPIQNPQDVILPMKDEYMQQIICGEKTYEFRTFKLSTSVSRVWFYLNAPFSHIAYICEIDTARSRDDSELLPEGGLGNFEFNTRQEDWRRYKYAYRIRNVRKIGKPISLTQLKQVYGMKGAPRSLVYVSERMLQDVDWREQELILKSVHDQSSGVLQLENVPPPKSLSRTKRALPGESEDAADDADRPSDRKRKRIDLNSQGSTMSL